MRSGRRGAKRYPRCDCAASRPATYPRSARLPAVIPGRPPSMTAVVPSGAVVISPHGRHTSFSRRSSITLKLGGKYSMSRATSCPQLVRSFAAIRARALRRLGQATVHDHHGHVVQAGRLCARRHVSVRASRRARAGWAEAYRLPPCSLRDAEHREVQLLELCRGDLLAAPPVDLAQKVVQPRVRRRVPLAQIDQEREHHAR